MTSVDDMDDLTIYRAAACEAARRGAAVLAQWRTRFSVREKGRADLVTEADVGSQKAIQEYLNQRFPEHDFLGEEGPQARKRPGADAAPTWIVDPLDGTTNYVHDVLLYCVSIGLQLAGELVVGVVYEPTRDEMFHAARGQGAFLNDKRLKTSSTDQLGNALLATGFPPNLEGNERALEWWRYFAFRSQSLRRTGSTAINLAYLAAGRFDGYWAFDNHVWDVAGGVVLVVEAGGIVTEVDGGPYDPYSISALGSNGPLHPALVESMRTGP
jgi:myo-inositol-1(or 4)-monophosphatase